MYTTCYPQTPIPRWIDRLRLAWHLLRTGAPIPLPYPWYEPLVPIVSSDYAHFAELAVDKAEREFSPGVGTQDLRRNEARQWMMHFAREAGKSTDIQPWIVNFLIEWWVARRKGRF